ncbi:MAG: hypothetical protein H6736_20815 [Alphaproteobacteria bacterium]|nr:hypothetical protein [Alphaproteobacteria bacterium]MCB9694259.1 hypothetical protein [Alphaproteobacteria bacterium]
MNGWWTLGYGLAEVVGLRGGALWITARDPVAGRLDAVALDPLRGGLIARVPLVRSWMPGHTGTCDGGLVFGGSGQVGLYDVEGERWGLAGELVAVGEDTVVVERPEGLVLVEADGRVEIAMRTVLEGPGGPAVVSRSTLTLARPGEVVAVDLATLGVTRMAVVGGVLLATDGEQTVVAERIGGMTRLSGAATGELPGEVLALAHHGPDLVASTRTEEGFALVFRRDGRDRVVAVDREADVDADPHALCAVVGDTLYVHGTELRSVRLPDATPSTRALLWDGLPVLVLRGRVAVLTAPKLPHVTPSTTRVVEASAIVRTVWPTGLDLDVDGLGRVTLLEPEVAGVARVGETVDARVELAALGPMIVGLSGAWIRWSAGPLVIDTRAVYAG